jgi:DNA repair photolyase
MPVAIDEAQENITKGMSIQRGCENDCIYCFARHATTRFASSFINKEQPWTEPVKIESLKKARAGQTTILFPFTHDITEINVNDCIDFVKMQIASETNVIIVTKARRSVTTKMCEALKEHRDQVMFRFTIGSMSNDTLIFWEPGAPSFEERIESIEIASEMGFDVSAGLTPYLDINEDDTVRLIEYLNGMDEINRHVWISKMNNPMPALSCAGRIDETTMSTARELAASQTREHILSLHDRVKHLPKVRYISNVSSIIFGDSSSC